MTATAFLFAYGQLWPHELSSLRFSCRKTQGTQGLPTVFPFSRRKSVSIGLNFPRKR